MPLAHAAVDVRAEQGDARPRSILRRRRRRCRPDRTPATHTIVVQAVNSLGWFGRPALRTSLLSAADLKALPFIIHLMRPLARLVNRLGADFRWQHLPVPFEVYADGIDLVIFEEFGSARPPCTCRRRSPATS